MHRSGQWFERNEDYLTPLFEIHSGGHQGQETPVKSCVYCMGPWDTTGMPKRPHGLSAVLQSLLADEEDETDDAEDDRQGRTA